MKDRIDLFSEELNKSEKTKDTYKWALYQFYKLVGDCELDMKAYKKFLSDLKNTNHSPSTNRIIIAAVNKFYLFEGKSDFPEMKRLRDIYTVEKPTEIVNFERDSVETLISYCDNLKGNLLELRDRAAILTLVDTGFRIFELCKLKRGSIDWKDERTIVEGKRKKVSVVRFSRRSLDAIKDYLQTRSKMDGESGKSLGTLPLFAQHGKINKTVSIKPTGMRKSILKRMKEAGIKPKTVRVHDLRHSFVTTTLIESGGNLKLAKELARHEDISTTQRYAHYADFELDKAYNEIFNKNLVKESKFKKILKG